METKHRIRYWEADKNHAQSKVIININISSDTSRVVIETATNQLMLEKIEISKYLAQETTHINNDQNQLQKAQNAHKMWNLSILTMIKAD